jgi:hypothetical protein
MATRTTYPELFLGRCSDWRWLECNVDIGVLIVPSIGSSGGDVFEWVKFDSVDSAQLRFRYFHRGPLITLLTYIVPS